MGPLKGNISYLPLPEGLLDPPENSGNDFQANGSKHSMGSELSEDGSLSPIRRLDPPNTSASSDEENIRVFRQHKISTLQSPLDKTAQYNQSQLNEALGNLENWREESLSVRCYIEDYNCTEKIQSEGSVKHHTTRKTIRNIHAPKSEALIRTVAQRAAELQMKVIKA